LLATPEDADHLALADSGARIRLLLRNPVDENRDARAGLSLANIFADWETASRGLSGRTRQVSILSVATASHEAAIGPGRVRLLVRVASAPPEGLTRLTARAIVPRRANALQVIALPAGPEPVELLSALEESHQVEILSSTELSAGNNRRVGMEAGNMHRGCGLRIRFLPLLEGHGTVRLRVLAGWTPRSSWWMGRAF
jgi:hypothetical protein